MDSWQKKDLKHIWHPFTQAKDHEKWPPILIEKAKGLKFWDSDGKFYYDTIIHNADSFEFAVKTLGADRIVYGTDYPADMGYHQPAREIPGLSRLSEAEQEMILSGNAKKLYGL